MEWCCTGLILFLEVFVLKIALLIIVVLLVLYCKYLRLKVLYYRHTDNKAKHKWSADDTASLVISLVCYLVLDYILATYFDMHTLIFADDSVATFSEKRADRSIVIAIAAGVFVFVDWLYKEIKMYIASKNNKL